MMVQGNYSDKDLIDFLGLQESQDIEWGDAHAEGLAERIQNGDVIRGDMLPWSKTHDSVRFREGEVTIWAGMNGHMKSMMLGQVMMWISQEKRVGISSFEMPVITTMERMVRQAAGCQPSVDYARKWAEWNSERICYYNKLDTVPSDRVLGSMFFMSKELGCKHIMIDSLTKCGLPSGDRDAEKQFMDMLAATAKALNIHVHIVAHVRKPQQGNQARIPDKYDIRGAGELTDLVDNVMIVWANKKHKGIKSKMEAGMTLDADEKEYMLDNSSHRLICEKQRNGKWEGTIGLWFDDRSLQFLPSENARPLPFAI